MNTPAQRRWLLAVLFVAGFISGAACTAGVVRRFMPPPGMPHGSEIIARVRADLRSEAHITPEQEEQLAPVLEKHGAELDAIRAETLAKVLASIKAKNAAVEEMLTPEQRSQFEAHENKRLQFFKDQSGQPKPQP